MISSMRASVLWLEPVSETFKEAVALVSRAPRAERARRDNRTLVDDQILSFRIGAESVELLLSSSRVLRVFCDGDVIDWVFDGVAQLPAEPREYANEVEVTLESGQDSLCFKWHPEALLASRCSVRGLWLAPTTVLLGIAARGGGQIQFSQIADRGGRRRLFFDEL